MEKKRILTKKEKGVNRHFKNFLDKDYLGSHNLEKGEEMLLTIAKFEGEEQVITSDGSKSPKMVLYFKEEVPKMILNITNGNTISNLYGTHPDQWIDKQIQVFAAQVKAFGKTQDALRIRDFIPKRDVDIDAFIIRLDACTTLEDLKNTFKSFPVSAQQDPKIVAKKDALKTTLQ